MNAKMRAISCAAKKLAIARHLTRRRRAVKQFAAPSRGTYRAKIEALEAPLADKIPRSKTARQGEDKYALLLPRGPPYQLRRTRATCSRPARPWRQFYESRPGANEVPVSLCGNQPVGQRRVDGEALKFISHETVDLASSWNWPATKRECLQSLAKIGLTSAPQGAPRLSGRAGLRRHGSTDEAAIGQFSATVRSRPARTSW